MATKKEIVAAAIILGARGGSIKSPRKAAASAANGRLGGRSRGGSPRRVVCSLGGAAIIDASGEVPVLRLANGREFAADDHLAPSDMRAIDFVDAHYRVGDALPPAAIEFFRSALHPTMHALSLLAGRHLTTEAAEAVTCSE